MFLAGTLPNLNSAQLKINRIVYTARSGSSAASAVADMPFLLGGLYR
jgi:hypothetical protein